MSASSLASLRAEAAHAAFDLDAYCARIGYDGPRRADLATLRELVARHAGTIAYENVDPFAGRVVALDSASLMRKLVLGGRGGYCFEHNLLLREALHAVGFAVTGLAARVRWNQPDDALTPRTHMLLLVRVAGAPYVADVGFGSMTPTAPLRLDDVRPQATSHEPFRVLPTRAGYALQARTVDAWRTLYAFDLGEQLLVDYELASWYLCRHPESRFVRQLSAARPGVGCRHTLLDGVLTTRWRDGSSDRRALTSGAAVRAALASVFGVALPAAGEAPDLDSALERGAARADVDGGALRPVAALA